ncbi:hypothetical protein K8I61_01335 [bacterium]|nr:hypothetical protein [bacterium]
MSDRETRVTTMTPNVPARRDPPEFPRFWRILGRIHRMERLRRGRREAVLAERDRNLRVLLRFALKRCPFYADRANVRDPDNPRLSEFAACTKTRMMESFDGVITDPSVRHEDVLEFTSDPHRVGDLLRGRYVVAHTSGSTGLRGVFCYDAFAWETALALSFAIGYTPSFGWAWPRVLAAPLAPLRAAMVIPTHGHFASVLMPRIAPPGFARIVDVRVVEITDPIDRIAAGIQAIKPFAIHAYPTMLEELARRAEAGAFRAKPRIVTGAGEPFAASARAAIGRAWPKANIIDVYACTEAIGISATCPEGRHHLNEDWIVIESVDADGEPVPPGVRGERIFLTCLYNFLQPIIRYEISDAVTIDETPCPCGSPLATIDIGGRSNHTLRLAGRAGGKVTILPTPLLTAFMEVPGLRQYQIVEESPARLRMRYVTETGHDPVAVRSDMDRVLMEYLGRHGVTPDMERTFETAAEIERDPLTHKVTQVVNLAARERA